MSTIEHAECELEFLHNGDEMNELMRSQVLEIVRLFASHGHSGASAGYAISIITPLLKQEPVGPLRGTDDEWVEVSEGLFQNKRCSHVFKENGKAYDVDGRVFEEANGCRYTNRDSRVDVQFPYIPKREYVKVKSEEPPSLAQEARQENKE